MATVCRQYVKIGVKKMGEIKISSKGLTFFYIVIIAFIAIALCMLFIILIFSDILQIDIVVKSGEIERHNVNMANAILSWDRLVYEEQVGGESRLHRGSLDKSKLDAEFITAAGANIKTEMMYPKSSCYMSVDDLETSSSPDWQFSWTDPSYTPPTDLLPFVRTFPVAIKVGDSIHIGRLTISLRESWAEMPT